MVLTCPACSTRYLLDPRALGTGRTVRCAKCGHSWHQPPPIEPAPPAEPASFEPPSVEPPRPVGPPPLRSIDPEATPRPLPEIRIDAPRAQLPVVPRRKRRPWVGLGWTTLLVALVLAAAALVWQREDVVARWPQTGPIYARLGLPVASPYAALKFQNVSQSLAEESGRQVLVVKGELTNTSRRAVRVPNLKVVLQDDSAKELQSKVFPPPREHLPPGASLSFTTTVPQPNSAATGVLVTLAAGS